MGANGLRMTARSHDMIVQ